MANIVKFISESLSPTVFWSALGTLSTLAAVLVALFQPLLQSRRRDEHIRKLVQAEILANIDIVKNIAKAAPVSLPSPEGPIAVSPAMQVEALARNIDLRLWHQYRFDIAVVAPDTYQQLHSINRFAEAIIESDVDPRVRTTFRIDAAQSFISQYQKTFPTKGQNAA